MINFNVPPFIGDEFEFVKKAIKNNKICGDGEFTKLCNEWIERETGCKKALLTTSCTHALEMSAILCDIKKGDEVIMPSYTFVSTANAFVLRGAKIVFVDIRPDTMNIDEKLIEDAVTNKTKAIVPVHYAGVACEMDTIMDIAKRHNLFVVEDAAQGIRATYKGRALGSIGHFGCFSFHETKNYSMGEGGALLINDENYIERAEIIREKGTNRSKFWRGEVDKYTWIDKGSSYLPSEINAAYLCAQLSKADVINDDRIESWKYYFQCLGDYAGKTGMFAIPNIPPHCKHNAHMFYLKMRSLEDRTSMIKHLKDNNILSVFHYVPLHTSPFGKSCSVFFGDDKYTTDQSDKLLRLPLYYKIDKLDLQKVVDAVLSFYI